MKKNVLDRACRIAGVAVTVMLLLCGVLLIVACARIGLSGEAPYTRERVAAALARLSLPIALTALAVLVNAVLCLLRAAFYKEEKKGQRGVKPTPAPPLSPCRERVIRIAVLTAALCLIILGAFNGSMRDVLDKAVRICTECIGLG